MVYCAYPRGGCPHALEGPWSRRLRSPHCRVHHRQFHRCFGELLFTQARVSLVLVILLSVLLGMILMAILWSIHAWRLRSKIRAHRRKVSELEEQVRAWETSRPSSPDGPGSPDGAHKQADGPG